MKRIVTAILIVFLLLPGFVAGAPGTYGSQGGEQVGNGNETAIPGEQRIAENTTPGGEESAPDRQQVRAEENETAGDQLQQRIAENTTLREEENATVQNQVQNRVQLAVHALLAAENRTGGIGMNVSAIAREVNNSVQTTTRAEEQIQARNGLIRFFFGGDQDAARLIREEAQQNLERAAELRLTIGNCTCDDETQAMLQEQVRTIEQEQERLMTLANEELQNRGLLGWI